MAAHLDGVTAHTGDGAAPALIMPLALGVVVVRDRLRERRGPGGVKPQRRGGSAGTR